MRLRLAVTLAALGTALLAAAAPATAAPTVSNTNDSGPGSLRQAVSEAGPGETIAVPAGDYRLTSGSLEIPKSLTLAGQGSGATVIRATGPFRVFLIGTPEPGPIAVTLSGMTVRDGRALENPTAFGAGVGAIETNLTLRGVSVTGNVANGNGTNPGEKGGTVIGAGVLVISGTLAVADSQIIGNTAESGGGPGAPGGSAQGAGVVVLDGSYVIERSSISGNVASAPGGQGPSDNKQDGGNAVGAGIGVDTPNTPSSIVASTISGNVAEALPGPGGDETGFVAGGGYFGRTDGQPITIANSTFAQNVVRSGTAPSAAPIVGGGLVAFGEGGIFTITSTTIFGNRLEATVSKSQGGNLLAGGVPGSVVLGNSIVAAGVGPAGQENCSLLPEGAAVISSQGFNIDSLDQCSFHAAGDQVNKDPLLGPLQANGGPTLTMAPALGGPALDQGKSFGLTTDQRGVARPIDLPSIPNSAAPGADGSDVGAVELQPSNAFTLGKLTRNKKKGTANLAVILPNPSAGALTLSGKGLKTQTKAITGQAQVKLKVIGTRKVRKALRKKGKRKVGIKVTYAPTGNSAATQSRKAKLVKKRRNHKKKHPKPAKR